MAENKFSDLLILFNCMLYVLEDGLGEEYLIESTKANDNLSTADFVLAHNIAVTVEGESAGFVVAVLKIL
ncbi:hypothetical protein [Sphingobacterium sp. CZ-UAM]|uniref:hypothetical protein n=1 Tax=Sphingobacterium sp. CZ-UAM TaxID=1933868 RepID=UPI0011156DBE|nr:hypothetical protein [Sphingobacterium sp. CZ-UAM]